MHMYALVVIPDDAEDIDAAVTAAMEPYLEEWDEETEAHTGWWDWWTIGGRYSGRLDGYDPTTNPENSEPCTLCDATGIRKDMAILNGCNGCAGTGTAQKWPTRWAFHPGDIGTVAQITKPPYTLVTPTGAVHKEDWNGKDWDDNGPAMEAALAQLDPETRVVVVDYHD